MSIIDVAIPTGVGFAMRNITTIRSSDSVIMIRGASGTLNEVTQAYAHGKPLTVLQGSGGMADRLEEFLPHRAISTRDRVVKIEFVKTTSELFGGHLSASEQINPLSFRQRMS